MRKNRLDQLPLAPATIDHVHAKELAVMSDLLDRMPEAVALVHGRELRAVGVRAASEAACARDQQPQVDAGQGAQS